MRRTDFFASDLFTPLGGCTPLWCQHIPQSWHPGVRKWLPLQCVILYVLRFLNHIFSPPKAFCGHVCQKCVCVRGSAPNPARRAPQTPYNRLGRGYPCPTPHPTRYLRRLHPSVFGLLPTPPEVNFWIKACFFACLDVMLVCLGMKWRLHLQYMHRAERLSELLACQYPAPLPPPQRASQSDVWSLWLSYCTTHLSSWLPCPVRGLDVCLGVSKWKASDFVSETEGILVISRW